ncbi:MAG: hypothetical protein RR297_11620 [Clostridia bacterium]
MTAEAAAAYLKQSISRSEAELILSLIDQIDDPNIRRDMLARVNSIQVKARMTRIQAAMESIRATCAHGAEQEITLHQQAARESGSESYYRTIFDAQKGIGTASPFSAVSIQQIDAVLSECWLGKNYSQRVWKNADVLAEKLGEIVQTNVSTGRHWKRCVDDLKGYMVGSEDAGFMYAASRLLFTEQQRVNNEMSANPACSWGLTDIGLLP